MHLWTEKRKISLKNLPITSQRLVNRYSIYSLLELSSEIYHFNYDYSGLRGTKIQSFMT